MKLQQAYIVDWLLNADAVYDSVTITQQWILTTGVWDDAGFWQSEGIWP
jgi:hypothetical protein